MKSSRHIYERGAVSPGVMLVSCAILIGVGALAWEWHSSHVTPYKGDITASHHHHHHGGGKDGNGHHGKDSSDK